ncbi:hypothetical protein [Rubrivirga sp. IMCC45206]|uniref:hypothetical protein n=1 Tax=Rubrivirga sp. IMCC45206 TaxID=3391614 RepID=UPI00398FCD17
MGQQQLLLLVLGIVIVGLAVVVGIQAFAENKVQANLDSLVVDGVRIAADVQAWSLKPSTFGGPGTGEDWTDATFQRLGYPPPVDATGTCTTGSYLTENGCYAIADGVIQGVGFDGVAVNNNRVRVDVTGQRPESIRTQTATDGVAPDAPSGT